MKKIITIVLSIALLGSVIVNIQISRRLAIESNAVQYYYLKSQGYLVMNPIAPFSYAVAKLQN